MSKIILVTQPDFDLATRYLSAWCEECIDLARLRGNLVIDLKDIRANRSELESVIKKKKPHFIILNGHGNDDTVAGHDNETLVKHGENVEILKETVIYAISCSSAKLLGISAVKSGAICYIGYDDDFIFINDYTKIRRPKEDSLAKLFFEPSNEISIALIKGHTTGEAYIKSKNMLKSTIRRLLTSNATFEERSCLRYLLWNYQHHSCIGDQTAKL